MRHSILALFLASAAHAQDKPPSPADIAKRLQLPADLKIELVACEPQIESPVAMQFAPDGKLWVVEMRDYPNGPEKGKPPEGRIRVLEDKDGDGFFETSTIWADNLLYANGLLLWKDGAIVTAAPHIIFIRDTDGDGKADKREVLFEGFAALNPQLRVSHPTLGLDGWVYVANGLRGGSIIPAGKPDAKPLSLSGMDFRFDPLTGEHEAIAGMGQFGLCFDDWGNRFICDNRHHLRHVVLENRYVKLNPDLVVPSLVEDISVLDDGPLNSGGKIYPISKNWTTSNLHEGRFTAACGVFIYRGGLLPEMYRGAAFTCDPTGNLVHAEKLAPKGATFKATPLFDKKEFLASPDDWFRPVFLAHGPDDALYVVDMCRAVIEHPEFMPPELKTRPDLTWGKDKGRIWRIAPAKTKRTAVTMAKWGVEELVKGLRSDNAWLRMTAHRLLLSRRDKSAVEPIRRLIELTEGQRTMVTTVWLLAALDGRLDFEDKIFYTLYEFPRAREQLLLMAERKLIHERGKVKNPAELASVTPDDRLRFQFALAFAQAKPTRDSVDFYLDTVASEDRWQRLAVACGLQGIAANIATRVLTYPRFDGQEGYREAIVRELTALVGSRPEPEELHHFLRSLKSLDKPYADNVRRAALVGLCEGLERRGMTIQTVRIKLYPKEGVGDPTWDWVRGFLKSQRGVAVDAKRPLPERLEAVALLSQDALVETEAALFELLEGSHPVEIRLAAVRALGRYKNDKVASKLLDQWKTLSPTLRRETTEVLLRAPATTKLFLEAVEKKQVKPGEIDALRARQLLKHPTPAIRDLAVKVLEGSLPADRKEVLARYQASLKLEGDAKKGKLLFTKHCATCHRIDGVGTNVAPDISDTRTKTTSGLLIDILNPNQAIDNNYVNYVVETKSGKSLTGILATETASSITLKRAEGLTDEVLRTDIESITSTGLSLMADGFERNISIEEMADLLSFLKNWRYLDGSVPIK